MVSLWLLFLPFLAANVLGAVQNASTEDAHIATEVQAEPQQEVGVEPAVPGVESSAFLEPGSSAAPGLPSEMPVGVEPAVPGVESSAFLEPGSSAAPGLPSEMPVPTAPTVGESAVPGSGFLFGTHPGSASSSCNSSSSSGSGFLFGTHPGSAAYSGSSVGGELFGSDASLFGSGAASSSCNSSSSSGGSLFGGGSGGPSQTLAATFGTSVPTSSKCLHQEEAERNFPRGRRRERATPYCWSINPVSEFGPIGPPASSATASLSGSAGDSLLAACLAAQAAVGHLFEEGGDPAFEAEDCTESPKMRGSESAASSQEGPHGPALQGGGLFGASALGSNPLATGTPGGFFGPLSSAASGGGGLFGASALGSNPLATGTPGGLFGALSSAATGGSNPLATGTSAGGFFGPLSSAATGGSNPLATGTSAGGFFGALSSAASGGSNPLATGTSAGGFFGPLSSAASGGGGLFELEDDEDDEQD